MTLLERELHHHGVEELLVCNNSEPPTTIQTNTLLLQPGRTEGGTGGAGVTAEAHPWLDGCFTIRGTGDLEQLESFRSGHFLVQDAASKLAVLAAAPQPGMQVLDACAAPGGKSFSAGMQMDNRGRILSCDIHAGKVRQIRTGAKRLRLNCVDAETANAKEYRPDLVGGFDLVLCDVPCSGLGIIRKKPDIRWKEPEPLTGLPAVQQDILTMSPPMSKRAGPFCTPRVRC